MLHLALEVVYNMQRQGYNILNLCNLILCNLSDALLDIADVANWDIGSL
jgi:hypothetical protein